MKIDYNALIINRMNQSHQPRKFILIHEVIKLIILTDMYTLFKQKRYDFKH